MRIPIDTRRAWLALLIMSGAAYIVWPESELAVWIKPLPAVAATALVWLGGHAGHRILTAGLVIAAGGDVLVEFAGTARLGTLAFAVAVATLGFGLRPAAVLNWRRGAALAGAWAFVSGLVVVPSLGDRLIPGLVVMVATAWLLFVAGRGSPLIAVGATLVATNFTLFAVDLVVAPVPRWLVIGTYYAGLLLVAIERSADVPGSTPDRAAATRH